MFSLALGPIALALCGASSAADRALVDRILAEGKGARFLHRYLAARGLDWAAELIDQFADDVQETAS